MAVLDMDHAARLRKKKMPAQKVVETANAIGLSQYIDRFIPECGSRSTLASWNYQIQLETSSSISSADVGKCFELLASSSKDDYSRSSMSWRPKEKVKEMQLPDLRYILVRTACGELPDGFASFMLTCEDGKEVIYIYEIHLAEKLRGKGMGQKLMSLVEDAGRRAGVEKAMLTVFACNEKARSFYARLGYHKDEYSPEPRKLRGGIVKEPDYAILSKQL